eukprot:COSAG06_NODE_2133_length_7518_cov_11.249495_3_plen_139_part_00
MHLLLMLLLLMTMMMKIHLLPVFRSHAHSLRLMPKPSCSSGGGDGPQRFSAQHVEAPLILLVAQRLPGGIPVIRIDSTATTVAKQKHHCDQHHATQSKQPAAASAASLICTHVQIATGSTNEAREQIHSTARPDRPNV